MTVLRLDLEYDGADFHGWAAQPGLRTVEGVLTDALRVFWPHSGRPAVAGRTDAGVHAWGQVVSFRTQPGLDPWKLAAAVTSMLGPEIVVRSCELVDPGFDARHSALWRKYCYTIVN